MQKAERKQSGKRRPGRLGALLLCALIAVGGITAALLLRREAEEPPEPARQRITGAIVARTPEELRSLTVTRRGEAPWTAERQEDGRLYISGAEGGKGRPVDENTGRMLQDAAVNLTYEDVFTDRREDWDGDRKSFGLEPPLVTAVFRYTDGTEITARIGDSADPDDGAYYYLTVDGDDRLYAVAKGTVQDLNVEAALLAEVPQLRIHSALLDRITVENADGSIRSEWRLRGKISDRDAAENWQITAPFTYPADYDAMKNLRDSAEDLRLGAFVAEVDAEALNQYGLERPSAVIRLHMAEGSTGTVSDSGVYDVTDWEERTAELAVGAAKTEMTDYVRYGDGIYTVNHFTLDLFTGQDAMSTAARYLTATPLGSLESVLVENDGQETVYYALVRTENSEDSGDSGTEARCLRNSEEIPYETFAAAYERLLTVTVSGKLPENAAEKPAHSRYTFRTVSGGTHTLELSDFDGIHDAVKMDGCRMFYLIKGGMTELP